MQSNLAVKEETQMLVGFRVGAQLFALPVAVVKDALRGIEASPVPLAPDAVAGIAAHRDKTLAVIDLRRHFGVSPKGQGAVLVVTHDGEEVALIVDKIEELITARAEDFMPVPVTVGEEWRRVTSQVVRASGSLVALLDLGSVLGALQ